MSENYKEKAKEMKSEAKKIMTKDELAKCHKIIHTAAAACAAAAFLPIPIADTVPITAAQIAMAINLGQTFNQKLTETGAKALIASATASLVGRTIVKFIPFAGWFASAAVAASLTEAVGWTLAVNFVKSAAKKENAEDFTQNDEDAAQEEQEQDDMPDEETLQQIFENLRKRTEPFLNGTKTYERNRQEYEALISDFSKWEDHLPDDLRDMCAKLYDLSI